MQKNGSSDRADMNNAIESREREKRNVRRTFFTSMPSLGLARSYSDLLKYQFFVSITIIKLNKFSRSGMIRSMIGAFEKLLSRSR